MFLLVETASNAAHDRALRAMFEARKRVFIDLLKWDLPALEGRYEIDQFDDEHARYLILLDKSGAHRASARLLPTTRPHLLGSLYPELCDGSVPSAADIFEVTRFCLDRRQSAAERLVARNQLVTSLAAYAQATGVSAYTGVAEMAWLTQILSFGWDASPLGLPRRYGRQLLGALHIAIADDTLERLQSTGIHAPAPFAAACGANAA